MNKLGDENKALLEKLEGVTQDLNVTQQLVDTLKEGNQALRNVIEDKDYEITRLKAKLYDITVGTYL